MPPRTRRRAASPADAKSGTDITGCGAGDGVIRIYDHYTLELRGVCRVKVNS